MILKTLIVKDLFKLLYVNNREFLSYYDKLERCYIDLDA